jgi:UDP-N-acetylmuramate dehydrogenase
VSLHVEDGASLKALNSFGVEARAHRLLRLSRVEDLDEALAALASAQRRLVLGGGSNVLFAGDFDGSVLHVALRGRCLVEESGDEVVVEAAAGENWHDFVDWTLAQGLSGLENLSLIPGTVGASPIQNIGAYGVEMCERFESLAAVDLVSGESGRFTRAECRFGYRDSIFKHAEGAQRLILSVRYRLSRSFQPRLDYGELRAELERECGAAGTDAHGDANPTPHASARSDARPSPRLDARAVARAVIAIRRRKLPDPAVLGNAGSFFRNPVVGPAEAAAVAAEHPGIPHWPANPGAGLSQSIKLSAGWMIERCGWKGFREGDAGVHERHALVLVNYGAASGAQMLALAERIRESVALRFGVQLEPEPAIVR